jgi:hypothetical protein
MSYGICPPSLERTPEHTICTRAGLSVGGPGDVMLFYGLPPVMALSIVWSKASTTVAAVRGLYKWISSGRVAVHRRRRYHCLTLSV